MSEKDFRAEFMAKSQALGRADQGDQRADGADDERNFQKRLDSCKTPREVFVLKSEWVSKHGSLPNGHSDQSDQGQRADQSGKDPRAAYLAKLRAEGMNVDWQNRNDGQKVYRQDQGRV